jgi:hypothetical protein
VSRLLSDPSVFVALATALRAGPDLPDGLQLLVQSSLRFHHLLLGDRLADRAAPRTRGVAVRSCGSEAGEAGFQRPGFAAVRTRALHLLVPAKGPRHSQNISAVSALQGQRHPPQLAGCRHSGNLTSSRSAGSPAASL